MIAFLIIINFIIDGVIMLGLFLLYTKFRSKEENTEKQERMAREIEGTFQAYLEEIKEENRRFEQQVNHHTPAFSSYAEDQTEEPQPAEKEPPIPSSVPYQPPEIEEKEMVELSDEVKVKQMHDQGLSIEQIARTLDIGKTEVELMLKFKRK